eukprot:scaffold115289_cov36-Phaeocystis_antarctica.AAC.1
MAIGPGCRACGHGTMRLDCNPRGCSPVGGVGVVRCLTCGHGTTRPRLSTSCTASCGSEAISMEPGVITR